MAGSNYNSSANAKDPYAVAASGSIVDRAGAILEQDAQRTASSASLATDASGLPFVSDFERSTRDLREQAQDLVNAFVDLLERLPSAIYPAPIAPRPATGPTVRVDGAELPALRPASASVGQVATTALGLVNETSRPATVVLRATSLVSQSGDEIPAQFVSFEPSSLVVPPASEHPVRLAVRLPTGTRPGKYSGLVHALGLDGARAVIVVDAI